MAVSGSRLVTVALWLCAAGALWLLLSPAASERRALTERVRRLEAAKHGEWVRGVGLERWRDGLEGDPSVIEKKARELGYGRLREYVYVLSPDELQAMRVSASRDADTGRTASWSAAAKRSTATVLMLLIAGVVAVAFFADLKVVDPRVVHEE